jgi:aspartyl protease family protein
MGHVRISVTLANPDRPEEAVVAEDALVDTGATFTTVPRAIADRLSLQKVRERQIRTASGVETLDESFALFDFEGNRTVTPVLITNTLEFVLVGVLTLEALGLVVDPAKGELRTTDVFLL